MVAAMFSLRAPGTAARLATVGTSPLSTTPLRQRLLAPACSLNNTRSCSASSTDGRGLLLTTSYTTSRCTTRPTTSTATTRPSTTSTTSTTSTSSTDRRGILLATSCALLCSPAWLPGGAGAAIIDEDVATSVFSRASRSTVSVVVYKVVAGSQIQQGVGSGIVWDAYGHVVTNYHCISNTDKRSTQAVRIAVQAVDGTTVSYPASIVSMDPYRDVAVLHADLPAEEVDPIRVGLSRDLKVGQSVFALGHPYGLSQTLTTGVVSGLNRAIPSSVGTRIYGAIQMDAQVNGGSSGGPLLDSSGRLVGMNTASFTRSGTGRGSGVNFALPVDMLMEVVPNMVVYGSASGKRV